MNIRVAPDEPEPTHHISFRTRDGKQIGIILCDDNGDVIAQPQLSKIPVETTAQKQTSGSSSYADFDYPYSPVVQDDLSGGRGSIDYERDSTKYSDSFRCKSGRANKAYAGPQEQFPPGLRSQDYTVPGPGVKWHQLTDQARTVYKRFQASAGYTAALAWLLLRKHGSPADLTITIHADNANTVHTQLASITVPYTRMADILSEWICETTSATLVAGTYYWIAVRGSEDDDADDHWKLAVKPSAGTSYSSAAFTSTPDVAAFDLYYRLTDANVDRTCIPFEYKEQQYFAISPGSGAPKIFRAGDRGAADANTGQLTKLIDATKNWTTNEHAGMMVLITDGTGKLEQTPWRTVVSNTGNTLTVTPAWTITHDTTTEYVIVGDRLTEITGHGLTAPITDVHVSSTGVVYFCMGDAVTVRRMREYNNAGAWTVEYANEAAGTKAVFMKYKPQAQKIVIANNSDASGNVSVALMSNASVPAWGTDLTWAAAVAIDSKYRRINGMAIHPDPGGVEAVWIFKSDIPYILPGTGNPYPVNLEEMRTVRGTNNGVNPLRHGVYLYFPMQQGLERYYGAQFDDIGPNLGEGLPENRRGPISCMQGYPGKFFIGIDAGAAGYSSVMDSDGWHERYRAPLGQRIKALAFQVTPGSALDRLWIYTGNDLVYLPFPSDTVNELEDAAFPFTHEFAVTLARMHAGMFDVAKLVKKIKMQTEDLEQDTCWIELDYRLNEESDWQTFGDAFIASPTQEIDLTSQYGLTGKRMQFRIRGYTSDSSRTPVFLAIIINAVLRTDVKYMYPIQFRIMDNEPLLRAQEEDSMSAQEKLQILEDLADASSDSMILMRAISRLYDDRVVFLNPPTTRQVRFSRDDSNPFKRDVYVCTASLQEA